MFLNATMGPKAGAAVQANCRRFELTQRVLWQRNAAAPATYLGLDDAAVSIELHFTRDTHPDPSAVRAAIRAMAANAVTLALDSGFRFEGRIEATAWRESCDDDGRFVEAVLEVALTGKEASRGPAKLARG